MSLTIRKLIAACLTLGWLALPIADLLGSGSPAWRVAVVLAALGAWLAVCAANALDARSGGAPAGRTLALLAALAAIPAALTLADRPSWALLFVYAAIAGALTLADDRLGTAWVLLCTGLCGGLLLAAGEPAGAALALGATTLAMGFLLFALGRLLRANAALRRAREELARRRVDEERLRFARDLHDILGHDLSVVALKAQLARRLMDADPDAARRELADVEEVARTALQEVRDAVSGYRQPALASELAGARTALDAAGIACTVERPDAPLPPSREAVLAWGVREATTNVIRHSGARHCAIRIAVDDREARLEVTDDGRADAAADPDGTGLRGLTERAADAGGAVVAGPRPDGGFGLELRVPLAPAA